MAYDLPTLFSASNDPALVRQMNEQETRDMTQILLMAQSPEVDKHFPVTKGKDLETVQGFASILSGLFAITVKRLVHLTPEIEYDPLTVLFLASLADSPGTAVLWAYTLAKATKDRGEVITVDLLTTECIPWGLPTQQRLRDVWNAQKGLTTKDGRVTDNYIDSQEAWEWAQS